MRGPLVLVAGARPNFMKIAPILRELESRGPPVETLLVHTGQHYDAVMSDVFFEQLGIRTPDGHLQIGSASHGEQTGLVMIAFEKYLTAMNTPAAAVVVVGDVNSTMACALVAVKLGIGCAHVEAGLRSFDRGMPEEINRVVTDAVADLLLVSDPAGLENLRAEGVPDERVRFVGNVMIDTLVHQLEAARALAIAEREGLPPGGYAYVTLHRPSNVDSADRLAALVDFRARGAARVPVLFPVHPRTAARLDEYGLRDRLAGAPGVHLREPLGYRENLGAMDTARLVISDSGGIQEETTFLGIPCVTLRPNTERPVTETSGTNTVVGEDLDAAWSTVASILDGRYKQGTAIDGWDGQAAVRIVDELVRAYA
jgi:UDP-N-acetylglucosamine 2-epimerase (non-hydrolysing)